MRVVNWNAEVVILCSINRMLFSTWLLLHRRKCEINSSSDGKEFLKMPIASFPGNISNMHITVTRLCWINKIVQSNLIWRRDKFTSNGTNSSRRGGRREDIECVLRVVKPKGSCGHYGFVCFKCHSFAISVFASDGRGAGAIFTSCAGQGCQMAVGPFSPTAKERTV